MRTTRSTPSNLRLLGLVLCGLVLSACSQELEVDSEVVTGPFFIRDGITYDQNTNEPVTGTVETFHPNGQLQERGNFIDGKREGLREDFYDNGQLETRRNYIDGELNGPSEDFYENGRLWGRQNFINGDRDGLVELFDENGNLTRTGTVRNGVFVESTTP